LWVMVPCWIGLGWVLYSYGPHPFGTPLTGSPSPPHRKNKGRHPQGLVALPRHALQRFAGQGQAPARVEAAARPGQGFGGLLQVRWACTFL
jgi:hypothetical protein